MNKTLNDRSYWNVVKGIGIICVVVGHCCIGAPTRFVYLFHLPLFFFVSGFLYNEEKYGDDPYLNVASRLKSSWMKYVLISWGMILLHNFFFDIRILGSSTIKYSKVDLINEMCKAVLGMTNEQLAGTLWFVPVLVFGVSILGFIVAFSRKIYNRTNSIVCKYIFQFVIVICLATVGYILQVKGVDTVAQMQVTWNVMPFIWIGYLIRNLKIEFQRYLNPIFAILCVLILVWAQEIYYLDLALNSVFPLMYIIAFLGIYLCLYLAHLFVKVKITKMIMNALGEISFEIMFVHFLLFRLFDWCYIICHDDLDFGILNSFAPIMFVDKWWAYLLIGLVFPFLVYVTYSQIRTKFKIKRI